MLQVLVLGPTASHSVLTSLSQSPRSAPSLVKETWMSLMPALQVAGDIRFVASLNDVQVCDSAPALAQTLSACSAQGPAAAAEPDAAGADLLPAALGLHPEANESDARPSESAMATLRRERRKFDENMTQILTAPA